MSPSSLPSALVIALSLLSLACKPTTAEKEAVKETVIAVTTVAAATRPMPDTVALTGELVASAEAHVSADTNGVVTALKVERGQHVSRGDVIATVDARTAQLGADAASAQSALAQVQLKNAQEECARAETLHRDGAMPNAQYDRAITQCAAQARAVEAAQANASLAGTNAAKSQIRAPFSGTVGEKLVDVGEFVGAAQPVVTLYTDEALRVRFSVPERQSGAVREGQTARFEVTTAPDVQHDAIVRYVSPALRAPARDLVVEAEVQDATGLKPGMYARLDLAVDETPRVTVPDAAIHTEGSVSTIYVVRGDRAFRTVVRLGGSKDGSTSVLTDITEGDLVVLNPPETLHDGAQVNATAGGN